MRKIYFYVMVCGLAVWLPIQGLFAQSLLEGVVLEQRTGSAISDVNILAENDGIRTVTDSLGRFFIPMPDGMSDIYLLFTKVGYADVAGVYQVSDNPVRVYLHSRAHDIEEVEINTGYQWIPRERATGSFVHIGNEQLAAIPGRSIIDKLDGIMSGLQFDNRNIGATSSGSPVITVRGMNTFSTASSMPLIVVDNFPYEGDLESINPHDVESVTMMRDAAATSIWGARAGNGVLVINLKKPEQSGRTVISWSSNISITEKPDLHYHPTMSSSDFVDVELFLYEQNYYRSALTGSNSYRTVFSPVVQALNDLETGKISQEILDRIIEQARSHDYRDDLLNHYYRNTINQQHHFSVSKRTGNHSLRFSAGFDQMDGGFAVGNQKDNRYSFTLFNQYDFSNRFSTSLNINYWLVDDRSVGGFHYPLNPQGGKNTLYPYARLIDKEGNRLPIPQGLNSNFIDTVGRGDLLDWRFVPLEDRNHVFNDARTSRIHPTFTLQYNPFASLKIEAIYNGDFQFIKSGMRYGVNSYEVRDQVNRFTQINGEHINRQFPLGEIYAHGHSDLNVHKIRFSARMDEELFDNHRLTWILGGEMSDVQTNNTSQRVYGYNPFTTTSIPVDHVSRYPMYLGGTSTISNGQNFRWSVRRLVSLFGNASYALQGKYILSSSIRRDASNVFGVKANERWNPLWSVGLAWNIQRESFMKEVDWISDLRLRITHGHSGNLGGGTTSDRVVISYSGSPSNHTNLPYATISSPPNPSLKWENVQMNNYGLDFSMFQGSLNGSIEYFSKKVTDLISHDPIDRTTGFINMNRNVARINGEGMDLSLNFHRSVGPINWRIGSSFSYTRDWTTVFKGLDATILQLVSSDNSIRPIVGKSLMPVHSYRFAGLDPENGDPMGYFNGEISKDYRAISRDSMYNLVYHGSGRPLYYGYVNQTLQFRGFSLFINVSFRAGHFYKRSTINYNSLYTNWITHGDFNKRWQQPGDESVTTVPSMVYPVDSNRDAFYLNSEANVDRGDVIRLQQIQLSYRWDNPVWRIRAVNMGVHASNLGILWKASKGDRDPDYLSIPPSRVISTRLNIQF